MIAPTFPEKNLSRFKKFGHSFKNIQPISIPVPRGRNGVRTHIISFTAKQYKNGTGLYKYLKAIKYSI
jgi:hypothetical protein